LAYYILKEVNFANDLKNKFRKKEVVPPKKGGTRGIRLKPKSHQ